MRPTAGRWVSGEDFFDREGELRVLESHVADHNHLLVTGQRRMGKTSIARELGRRLERRGWIFIFADVEGATCPEDAVATIAKETYPVRSIASRLGSGVKEWFSENFEEVGAHGFHAKIRAGLNAGNWRRLGEKLLRHCADQEAPVLLVIDELPIFLKRSLKTSADGWPTRLRFSCTTATSPMAMTGTGSRLGCFETGSRRVFGITMYLLSPAAPNLPG